MKLTQSCAVFMDRFGWDEGQLLLHVLTWVEEAKMAQYSLLDWLEDRGVDEQEAEWERAQGLSQAEHPFAENH